MTARCCGWLEYGYAPFPESNALAAIEHGFDTDRWPIERIYEACKSELARRVCDVEELLSGVEVAVHG